MIKRLICSVLVVMLFISSTLVYAEPSTWAKEFVENANNDNLIPDILNNNYQNNIKRYEYVLLALKVLDQNKVLVSIDNKSPFKDIDKHPYKEEIIKAYNAGIVGGYEDNTFRPDNEISRQEVAALVYNLVKKINSKTVLPTGLSAFSDANEIGSWAIPFIEFNYANKIISGVGKKNGYDTMNPKGRTTREQAITLLYKVSINKSLLGKLGFEDTLTNNGRVSKDDMNELAKLVGSDVLTYAKSLVETKGAQWDLVRDDLFVLKFADNSKIMVLRNDFKNEIEIQFRQLDKQEAYEYFESFKKLIFGDIDLKSKYDEALIEFKSSQGTLSDEEAYLNGLLNVYSSLDNDIRTYTFNFRKYK